MKKIKLLLFFSQLLSFPILSQNDTLISKSEIINKVSKINFSNFIDSPLVNFVTTDFLSEYKEHYYIGEPPGILKAVCFVYSQEISIDVYLKDFEFVKQFNTEENWDFELLKKEKISSIVILKNDVRVKNVTKFVFESNLKKIGDQFSITYQKGYFFKK